MKTRSFKSIIRTILLLFLVSCNQQTAKNQMVIPGTYKNKLTGDYLYIYADSTYKATRGDSLFSGSWTFHEPQEIGLKNWIDSDSGRFLATFGILRKGKIIFDLDNDMNNYFLLESAKVVEDPLNLGKDYCKCVEADLKSAKDSLVVFYDCEKKIYPTSRLMRIYMAYDDYAKYDQLTIDSARNFSLELRDIIDTMCFNKTQTLIRENVLAN